MRRKARSAPAAALFGLLSAAALSLPPLPAAAAPGQQAYAALPPVTASLEIGGAAKPIVAWVGFCRSYAEECALDTSEPTRIALTQATWSTIVAVNRKVNRSVQAMTDMEHLHLPDRWDLAEDGIGDCEDFQLLKRHLLAKAGLPRRAMRMTVVIDEKGEGHAVLTLITDRGDLILDNKTTAILPWHQTGYTFIKRESQDAVAWVSLGGLTSPTTTANR